MWLRCARSVMSSPLCPSTRERRPEVGWADLAATSLENDQVLLRPIRPEDRLSLRAIALDPEIWRYFVVRITTNADFDAFFDAGLADQRAGRRVVYHIT